MTRGDALPVHKENEILPESDQPTQYHIAATTTEVVTDGFFVTVLHPYRHDQPELQFIGSHGGATRTGGNCGDSDGAEADHGVGEW